MSPAVIIRFSGFLLYALTFLLFSTFAECKKLTHAHRNSMLPYLRW